MSRVTVVEVGPRDGLQNITKIVPTSIKIELIQKLAATGLPVIESTSFVSPKWIPQLADGPQVLGGIKSMIEGNKGTQFPALVPNAKGMELAIRNGSRDIAVFVSATEGFSRRNINCTVDESLARVRAISEKAKAGGIKMRGYVSCIFLDPYDGPTKPSQVIRVTQALLNAGCYEVSLGDTLGVGTVADVEALLGEMLKTIPASKLAGHFHDTYGQAIANVIKSYEMGLRTFDSSVAGLGGCPFAKDATGNLATEDLLYTLGKMGIYTGVDLTEVVKIGAWISEALGLPNGSRAGAALAIRTLDSGPTTPKASNRPWTTVESTPELSVYRSGVNIKIILTREKNGNALTTSMVRSLTRLFRLFSADESVFRIILSGTGRYFCTGMDIKNAGTPEEQMLGLRTLFNTIDVCPKTTIAMINGTCLGGGVGLAFVCDLRLAAPDTRFKLTEVRLGLCPATISKYVIREWGLSFARAAMLTAQYVTALELADLKIIHKLASNKGDLDHTLDKMLDGLRFVAPRASSLSKDLLRAAWTDSGGERQDKVIESAFGKMMSQGSESTFALKEFRRGVREVDWETFLPKQRESKL